MDTIAAHSLRLLHDTWSSVLTSANTQDLLIPHPWLVDLHPSLHHLSTPMAHVHISGTSSSFSKGKNIQVKCPLEGLSQYIHNIKHMVICFGELTFLRHVISSMTPFRYGNSGGLADPRCWMHNLRASWLCVVIWPHHLLCAGQNKQKNSSPDMQDDGRNTWIWMSRELEHRGLPHSTPVDKGWHTLTSFKSRS